MHQALRQQMWSRLNSIKDEDLTTFVFSSLNQGKLIVVNKHEILVDGKLYDVVKKTVSGKQTTYVCINDRQEEKLLAKMKQASTGTQQLPQGKLARIIADHIIKSAVAGYKDVPTQLCDSVQFGPFETTHYRVPDLQRILPPPEKLG